jgi:hypothetical protein
MNAVDTNVLVYSVDQHEPGKRTKALDGGNVSGTLTKVVCPL